MRMSSDDETRMFSDWMNSALNKINSIISPSQVIPPF